MPPKALKGQKGPLARVHDGGVLRSPQHGVRPTNPASTFKQPAPPRPKFSDPRGGPLIGMTEGAMRVKLMMAKQRDLKRIAKVLSTHGILPPKESMDALAANLEDPYVEAMLQRMILGLGPEGIGAAFSVLQYGASHGDAAVEGAPDYTHPAYEATTTLNVETRMPVLPFFIKGGLSDTNSVTVAYPHWQRIGDGRSQTTHPGTQTNLCDPANTKFLVEASYLDYDVTTSGFHVGSIYRDLAHLTRQSCSPTAEDGKEMIRGAEGAKQRAAERLKSVAPPPDAVKPPTTSPAFSQQEVNKARMMEKIKAEHAASLAAQDPQAREESGGAAVVQTCASCHGKGVRLLSAGSELCAHCLTKAASAAPLAKGRRP